MAEEPQDILEDGDLEDLFGDDDDAEEATPAVTHVAVPTPQIKLGKPAAEEEEQAPLNVGPKIQIQIPGAGGAGAAGATTAAAAGGANNRWLQKLAAIPVAIIRSCDRTLELANRPFGWMSDTVRKYVGIVAAVTLVTSLLAAFLGPLLFPRYDALRVLEGLHDQPTKKSVADDAKK